MESVSVVLLAGGKGLRMGLNIPKQYLPLNGKPLILYSFETLRNLPYVKEIIVVCEEEFHYIFDSYQVKFANPGPTRQESLFNGLKKICNTDFVCVHDAARPFFKSEDIDKLLKTTAMHGAATLATKVVYTIKEANEDNLVLRSIPRENLWEIHTPQMIKKNLLEKGIAHAIKHQISVSDDVSLIEQLNLPVKLVQIENRIIKVTTPQDLDIVKMTHG